MSVATLRRSGISQLEYTVDLLEGLSEPELEVVQAVALALHKNNHSTRVEASAIPFPAQNEEELLARIDHSLSQIDTGSYEDAVTVEDELLAEIGA